MQYGMTKPLTEKNAKFMVSVLKKSTNCGAYISCMRICINLTWHRGQYLTANAPR